MEQTQFHDKWRKAFDFRFLSSEDLDGDVTVEIEDVVIDEVKTARGTETVMALKMKGAKKLFVVNKTNARTIASIAGSPNTGDWIGKKITLTTVQVNAFGLVVAALRVKKNFENVKIN